MAEYSTLDESETLEEAEIPEEAEVQDYPRYVLPAPVYLALKWVALLLLPLAAVTYQALAGIWGLPLPGEISQTCSIAGLAIGALIGASEVKNLIG